MAWYSREDDPKRLQGAEIYALNWTIVQKWTRSAEKKIVIQRNFQDSQTDLFPSFWDRLARLNEADERVRQSLQSQQNKKIPEILLLKKSSVGDVRGSDLLPKISLPISFYAQNTKDLHHLSLLWDLSQRSKINGRRFEERRGENFPRIKISPHWLLAPIQHRSLKTDYLLPQLFRRRNLHHRAQDGWKNYPSFQQAWQILLKSNQENEKQNVSLTQFKHNQIQEGWKINSAQRSSIDNLKNGWVRERFRRTLWVEVQWWSVWWFP